MAYSHYQNYIGFDGIEQAIGKMKEYFAANRASYFGGGKGMGNDHCYQPMHFRNECQPYSGGFIFVVAGGLPKLFFCFRQKFEVHDNSVIALLKTSLPEIP